MFDSDFGALERRHREIVESLQDVRQAILTLAAVLWSHREVDSTLDVGRVVAGVEQLADQVSLRFNEQ